MKITKEIADSMCQKYLSGQTIIEIARHFDISKTTVWLHLIKNNITIRPKKYKLSDEEITQICNDYQSGKSMREIAPRYNIWPETVSDYLHRAKIPLRKESSKLSSIEIRRLCATYSENQDILLETIATQFGICVITASRLLHLNNIPIHPHAKENTYKCNEEYFDNISTPEQAYWIGFLAADGSVMKGKTPNASPYLVLTLHIKDKGHVEKFKRNLSSESPIKLSHRKRAATIVITSQHLCESLAKFSIIPHKSKVLQFADNIPYHLLPHYMRGCVDGDGCWHVKIPLCDSQFSLYSKSPNFIRRFQEHLVQMCDLNPIKIYNGDTIRYGGRRQLNRIAYTLYKGATVYLPRKWEIVRKILYDDLLTPIDIVL